MLPIDILNKVVLKQMNADEAALEAAARVRIPHYKPFSLSSAELKKSLEATHALGSPINVGALKEHAKRCSAHKGKCSECAQLYDAVGHAEYMRAKWGADLGKSVGGIRVQASVGEPFVPDAFIEAVHELGAGQTQYVIIFEGGKGYVTIDAAGRVHSHDLRGVNLIDLPALMMQIGDHHRRHPIKK